jgi:hypothetical protein
VVDFLAAQTRLRYAKCDWIAAKVRLMLLTELTSL